MFDLIGEQYERFMGRYSRELAPAFAEFAGIESGMRVLDVGAGTGLLSAELVRRVGAGQVAAVDPSEPLLAACRARLPQVATERTVAEQLPFADDSFDAALAQLVVSFMVDAPRAVGEMRRVVRAGGTLAVCMWAHDETMELLHRFWRAALTLDPRAADKEVTRYRDPESLRALLDGAGLGRIEAEALEVEAAYASYDELWSSLCSAAGPIGMYVASRSEAERAQLDVRCRAEFGPSGPLTLRARAWAVRGTR